MLENRWMKVFTVFYLLIGIGILVEILRRLGAAFVTVRRAEDRDAASEKPRQRVFGGFGFFFFLVGAGCRGSIRMILPSSVPRFWPLPCGSPPLPPSPSEA